MHYLDHAATTPVPHEAAQAMLDVLTKNFGNPSSQYKLGRDAKALVDDSRSSLAHILACKPEQLIFTSCGTESDNWAIRAALYQNRRIGKHIITSAVEHSAVLQCVKQLEQEGFTVSYLKPDPRGRISADQVAAALRDDTALVSLMLVNNETGVRFPIEDIAGLLKNHPALLHTDAVQGFLKVPFSVKSLPADFISISAHKIGGPKGIGALYAGNKAKNLRPLFFGGGQEFGLRPGTEAVAQIVGFARAAQLRFDRFADISLHLRQCREYAVQKLLDIPDLRILPGDAPHILAVSLPGYPSQNIVSELSDSDIFISAGSACHRGKPSHVFAAMGLDKKTAAGTIRISFGPDTSFQDIDALASALAQHRRTRFPML